MRIGLLIQVLFFVSDLSDGLIDEESKILNGLSIELNVLLKLVNFVFEVLEVLASCLLNILIEQFSLDVVFVFFCIKVRKSLLIFSFSGFLF